MAIIINYVPVQLSRYNVSTKE